jgi:hypothetical protein
VINVILAITCIKIPAKDVAAVEAAAAKAK